MDVNPDMIDPRSGASPDGEIVLSGTGMTFGEALAEAIAKMDWAGALAAAGIVPDNSPQSDDIPPPDPADYTFDAIPVTGPLDNGHDFLLQ